MPWRSSSRKKADATSCDWAHAHCWAPRRSQLCPPRSGRAAASEGRSSRIERDGRRRRRARRRLAWRDLRGRNRQAGPRRRCRHDARYRVLAAVHDQGHHRNGLHAARRTRKAGARPANEPGPAGAGFTQGAGGIRRLRQASAAGREARHHPAPSAHPHLRAHLQQLE